MPPKPKFTREQVAQAALEMIKEGGASALTARDLGARMGTSARPIFTLFKNMEDVKRTARELAVKEFMAFISDYREYTPAFKRIGMMIVAYGIHEPELFKLLFLQEHPRGELCGLSEGFGRHGRDLHPIGDEGLRPGGRGGQAAL